MVVARAGDGVAVGSRGGVTKVRLSSLARSRMHKGRHRRIEPKTWHHATPPRIVGYAVAVFITVIAVSSAHYGPAPQPTGTPGPRQAALPRVELLAPRVAPAAVVPVIPRDEPLPRLVATRAVEPEPAPQTHHSAPATTDTTDEPSTSTSTPTHTAKPHRSAPAESTEPEQPTSAPPESTPPPDTTPPSEPAPPSDPQSPSAPPQDAPPQHPPRLLPIVGDVLGRLTGPLREH